MARQMLHRRLFCALAGPAGLALCLNLLAPQVFAQPPGSGSRSISEAEFKATQMLMDYVAHGPDAWWRDLSERSLLRQWGRDEFVNEMAVRLGPHEGSEFVLQTPGPRHDDDVAIFHVTFASGLEDFIEMRFVDEDGEPKLHRLEILANPRSKREAILDRLGASPATPSPPPGHGVHPAASATLAVLLAVPLVALSLRRRRGRIVYLATAFAVAAMACSTPESNPGSGKSLDPPDKSGNAPAAEAPKTKAGLIAIAALRPLRDVLTGGAELDLEGLMDLLPGDAPEGVRKTGRAMIAQILLAGGRVAETKEILDGFDFPPQRPLVGLLRARLALDGSASDGVVEKYRSALERAPDVDLLRVEAAYAALVGGWEKEAYLDFKATLNAGSRMAEVWYIGAQIAAVEGDLEIAERYFQTAFGLEPLTRESLFEDPLLSSLGTRPAIFPQLKFSETAEPKVSPRYNAPRQLPLPASATAFSVGERLDIEVGGSRVRLLGAAELIPGGTPVWSAADAEAKENAEVLEALDALTETLHRGGIVYPKNRRQAELAGLVLAKERRWEDLVRLTQTDSSEGTPKLPPDLIKLRALALTEVGRRAEALGLLVDLAHNARFNSRRDPGTFYQMAELMVRLEEYELALNLIHKANNYSTQRVSSQRILQIEMDRDLEADFATYQSRHFTLRYPKSAGEDYPKELSYVLEAERERLLRWIPMGENKEKIEVHLFELEPFQRAYSGGISVLGVYDGRVRVPLADLKSLHPLLVNIVSHEVAHAMIDQVTGGRAPKWFDEGLASHIEMDQKAINPIPDMYEAGRYLSFAVMEPILAGFSEPQLVSLAYTHSTWALHFIEARHGIKAIHRMLKAFGDGLSTDEVLTRVLETDVAGFDEGFKAWALGDAPAVWPTRLVRYDQKSDGYIERKKPKTVRRYAMPEPAKRTLPKVAKRSPEELMAARRGEPPPGEQKPQTPEEIEKAIRKWHAHYTSNTQPIKAAFGEMLAIYRGQKTGNLIASCSKLSRSLERLHSKPETLQSPSPPVASALTKAYRQIGLVANVCQRNHRGLMSKHLEDVTASLGQAHAGLERYGLKP
ncbi:MAG: hypothetical protein AAGM22_22740 [Acidobacteriota bacterium]